MARVAYAEGARRVEVEYLDVYVRRARAELAPDEAVGWAPPWMLQRVEEEAERRTAYVNIVGEPDPDLFAGLDPAGSQDPDARPAAGDLVRDRPRRARGRSSRSRPRAGQGRCSASQTSRGCGTRSAGRFASTSRPGCRLEGHIVDAEGAGGAS